MIHFFLLVFIIFVLTLIIKETLFVEYFRSNHGCPPFTFLLSPDNSLRSLSKGRCSVGGDNYIQGDDTIDMSTKERSCYGEAISLSPGESIKTPGKASCKK